MSSIIDFICHVIYVLWFWIHRYLTEQIKKHVSPAFGAFYGMLLLEGHTICRTVWYGLVKYRKEPHVYGFDGIQLEQRDHRPVLLLPGAVGSWPYLGDLATALRSANIPVFVINIGVGLPNEAMRRAIFHKIQHIREMIASLGADKSTAVVDIVAHSNGGNLGLYSAFDDRCCTINDRGELIFVDEPKANPFVGKVITVALPTNAEELNWMKQINKANNLFNVNAKYDALMSHKICALTNEYASQTMEISAAHVGIVFQNETHQQVINFLNNI